MVKKLLSVVVEEFIKIDLKKGIYIKGVKVNNFKNVDLIIFKN